MQQVRVRGPGDVRVDEVPEPAAAGDRCRSWDQFDDALGVFQGSKDCGKVLVTMDAP